ncbi:hypothetical protein ABPG72_007323 [Tetrahymena utriculariae]
MNYLPFRLRLMLGLANPFKIKPQHCALNEQIQQIAAQFLVKKQISPTSSIYRFKMNDERKVLGIQLGENIQIGIPGNQQENQIAKIHPITRIDDPAIVDVLVNEENPEQQFFRNLKEKQEVVIKSDQNKKFVYDGFGKITIFNQGQVTQKKVDYLGILVQGYHISKVFSLIEGISTNGDKTNISILYVNSNLDESLFIDELTWYADEKKIHLGVLFEKVPDGVPVLKGKFQKHHVSDFMPPVDQEFHLIVAGSNSFQDECLGHLKSLGYQKENITLY